MPPFANVSHNNEYLVEIAVHATSSDKLNELLDKNFYQFSTISKDKIAHFFANNAHTTAAKMIRDYERSTLYHLFFSLSIHIIILNLNHSQPLSWEFINMLSQAHIQFKLDTFSINLFSNIVMDVQHTVK